MSPAIENLARIAAACLLAAGIWGRAGPTQAGDALAILVYHQIRVGDGEPADSEIAISLARFESQMRHLHEQGHRALGMGEVMAFLGGRPFSEKVVAIHFDDGWKSAQHALPVLERYGLAASFWIIAGTGIGAPHMDWEEVLQLSRRPRMELYSHSMTHPWRDGETLVDWVQGRTPGKGIEDARHELLASRRMLEQKLDRPYHELLGVAPDADEKAIKRAYFQRSRDFHPNRYFRREIGPYLERLNRIFKRIVLA